MSNLYDSTDMDKVFKIDFHESQTGRKVIDVTADVEHEPIGVYVGHKRSNSIDLSQSTLGTSNDTKKSTEYVNIPQKLSDEAKAKLDSEEHAANNRSNDIRNTILTSLEYFLYGLSDSSEDEEATQPLDPAPMFKPDEDIHISDDGTMIVKGDKEIASRAMTPLIDDEISGGKSKHKKEFPPLIDEPERTITPTPIFDPITDPKPITSYLFDGNTYKMWSKPDCNFCD